MLQTVLELQQSVPLLQEECGKIAASILLKEPNLGFVHYHHLMNDFLTEGVLLDLLTTLDQIWKSYIVLVDFWLTKRKSSHR